MAGENIISVFQYNFEVFIFYKYFHLLCPWLVVASLGRLDLDHRHPECEASAVTSLHPSTSFMSVWPDLLFDLRG